MIKNTKIRRELKKQFKKLGIEKALKLFREHKHKIRCWNNHDNLPYPVFCKDGGCVTDGDGELHHILCGECINHLIMMCGCFKEDITPKIVCEKCKCIEG